MLDKVNRHQQIVKEYNDLEVIKYNDIEVIIYNDLEVLLFSSGWSYKLLFD